jgi:catechol 2,3-dioxygenase-like lactoylglutathione lyase family enzyme
MSARVKVVGVDHLVLNVADVEASLAFYCGLLGLEGVRLEEWRAGKCRFPSVRVSPETIIDLAPGPRPGENLDHFCLIIEATDLEALVASGDFDVSGGAGSRYGARGRGNSFYVRDPDGNRIELRYYD